MKKARWTFLDQLMQPWGLFIPKVLWRKLTIDALPVSRFSPLVLLVLAVGIQLPGAFIAPGHQPQFVDV